MQSVAAIHRKHLKIHILTSLSHLTFALAQLLQAINIRPLASIKKIQSIVNDAWEGRLCCWIFVVQAGCLRTWQYDSQKGDFQYTLLVSALLHE